MIWEVMLEASAMNAKHPKAIAIVSNEVPIP